MAAMTIRFAATPIWWQGPAPFLFIPVPVEESRLIKDLSAALSYGWGCIPVRVRIGASSWSTSLIPKQDRYLLPIKKAISRAETITLSGTYSVIMELGA